MKHIGRMVVVAAAFFVVSGYGGIAARVRAGEETEHPRDYGR